MNRRIVVSQSHDDYPAILAEAMDVVAAVGQNLKEAATHLGCSTTQLRRFLEKEQ